jgi:hypothetical protein
MKLIVLGTLLTVAISPVALAQSTNYLGTSSNPATAERKDDSMGVDRRSVRHKMRTSRARHGTSVTTDYGGRRDRDNTSVPGQSFDKDDSRPRPR